MSTTKPKRARKVRVRPRRDLYGRVTAPARVWLTPDAAQLPSTQADACVPVAAAWLAALRTGERVQFEDARGAKRAFTVIDATEQGVWAEMSKTAYVVPGIELRRHDVRDGEQRSTHVGNLPAVEGGIDAFGDFAREPIKIGPRASAP